MSKPFEQQYLGLIQKGGDVSEQLVEEIYDKLEPISPSFLIGEWIGGDLNTGHPGTQALKALKWAGKNFRTLDDVDPIMVYNDQGERVWLESYGHACIREVKYRGKLSAAMIYDEKPIIDHFRFVDQNTVAGVMDTKLFPSGAGIYYFHLTRLNKQANL